MREIKFRVWHGAEKKMYPRAFQKISYVLLCDRGETEKEPWIPVRRASYEDCRFLECTDTQDVNGTEIYEGDILQIKGKDKTAVAVVGPVPDMYRSRNIHPLQTVFDQIQFHPQGDDMQIEVIGNQFECPELYQSIVKRK